MFFYVHKVSTRCLSGPDIDSPGLDCLRPVWLLKAVGDTRSGGVVKDGAEACFGGIQGISTASLSFVREKVSARQGTLYGALMEI